MGKRRRLSDSGSSSHLPPTEERERGTKRRFFGKSHLLDLPQELILRILHFLPVQNVLTVSRTSHKLHSLASDPQLWKSKFWTKFIHPRIQRRARLKLSDNIGQQPGGGGSLLANDWKLWLDDHILIQEERDLVAQRPKDNIPSEPARKPGLSTFLARRKGPLLDWKAKFRLRSNWQRGSASPSQVTLLTLPSKSESHGQQSEMKSRGPPLVGTFVEGYFFSADSKSGIRVFKCGGTGDYRTELCKKATALGDPICLAVEESLLNDTSGRRQKLRGIDFVVGFHNGSFAIYHFDPQSRQLSVKYNKQGFDEKERIEFAALCFPYLVMVTSYNELSILSFHSSMNSSTGKLELPPPNLPLYPPKTVSNMVVDRAWYPTCISFRKHPVSSDLIASVVFSVRSITIGTSITLQDLRLSHEAPKLISTRVTSPPLHDALDQAFFGRTANMAFTVPTCVSFRYPFILTSHADNTLVLYNLHTDVDGKLEIQAGHQLWGHNTSVMAVQVGLRKAVSVDRRGEVRVWDLQGRCEKLQGRDRSVRIVGSGDPLFLNLDGKQGVQTERCLVGFGEEDIVVLDKVKDLDHAKTEMKLVVYDFK